VRTRVRDARSQRSQSSIFLGRIVGVVFIRVNAKCAHQERPLKPVLMDRAVPGGWTKSGWSGTIRPVGCRQITARVVESNAVAAWGVLR